MDATEALTQVTVAVVAAGGLTLAREAVKARRARQAATTPVAVADSSLLVVAKARDELEEDNVRLRVLIGEERTRHAEDRAVWAKEKAALRAEIDTLEAKLRMLLEEVAALRTRTDTR